MTGSLLMDAADWFKARDTRIDRWYSDDQGRYAFRVTVSGQAFIVCAKDYIHDGHASFMASKVVQRAIDQGAYLLLFTGTGRQYVFDPATVDQEGDHQPATRDDRKARGETWVDIDADLSVGFESWYDTRETPPGVDDTTPTGITDWGGD